MIFPRMKADIVDTLTKARLTFPLNQLEYFFESSDRIKRIFRTCMDENSDTLKKENNTVGRPFQIMGQVFQKMVISN